MPLNCRGNRILALPPARKGRQGRNMTDKCALHPWVKAQSQPSTGVKIKSILLLFIMCSLFVHRQSPNSHTKKARITSVIYSPSEDQTETNKNKKQHHNTVFLNTITWGTLPYASPEGHGTTPFEECQRWSTIGPLGAAMRLTVLRQSPKDVSRPMSPR